MKEVINNTTGEVIEVDDSASESRALVIADIRKLTTDEKLEKIYLLQALEEMVEQLRFDLLPDMREYYQLTGEKTYKDDYWELTYTAGHTRKNFKKKEFKKDYPELYEKYIEEVVVKESVKIKAK